MQTRELSTIEFEIFVDVRNVWESGLMYASDGAKRLDIDVKGKKVFELIVKDGGDGIIGDHANFSDAKLLW